MIVIYIKIQLNDIDALYLPPISLGEYIVCLSIHHLLSTILFQNIRDHFKKFITLVYIQTLKLSYSEIVASDRSGNKNKIIVNELVYFIVDL